MDALFAGGRCEASGLQLLQVTTSWCITCHLVALHQLCYFSSSAHGLICTYVFAVHDCATVLACLLGPMHAHTQTQHTPFPPPYTWSIKDVGQDPESDAGTQSQVCVGYGSSPWYRHAFLSFTVSCHLSTPTSSLLTTSIH